MWGFPSAHLLTKIIPICVIQYGKGVLMIRLLVGVLLVGAVTYGLMNRDKVGDLKAEAIFKEEVEKVENIKLQIERDAQERVRQIDEQTGQ